MAHLTLQFGGPIVLPFSIHFGSSRRRDIPNWKIRSLLEASAIDDSLPRQRRNALGARSYLIALDGDTLDQNEA